MTATVEQIESWIVDVPTIRPHKLSMTTMGCQSLVIVRLTRSDGICGIGEATTMNNDVLTVLAESAELADSIDSARAMAAKERAEKRLASHDEKVDMTRAEAALQRAIVRLQLAQLR